MIADFDTIIVGGGAAGLFAGCILAKSGVKTCIIEPNRKLGRKLRITGKGRCNLTNNCTSEEVIKNTLRSPKFLYSALNAFSPADTMAWFEAHGVPLKTERGNRVFPVSDKADDIAECLEKELKRYKAVIIRDATLELLSENGAVIGVRCKEADYFAENVILATGGKSYPKTGSTGDGYIMASALGHTVTDIFPSLVPIVTEERYPADLCGLGLRNVVLSLFEKGKKKPVFSEIGEMSFMPYGISGPLTLSASCYIKPEKLVERSYRITVDLKPGLTMEQLVKRIQRDFDNSPGEKFEPSLSRLLPSQLIPVIAKLSEINPDKPCNQVTKEEKERLAGLLKGLSLTPMELRPIDEAIVTRGGIKTSEINPNTMESKLVKGLYFAGEIIDVDAFTGGFNLQIAFATANAAARAIIADCKSQKEYSDI